MLKVSKFGLMKNRHETPDADLQELDGGVCRNLREKLSLLEWESLSFQREASKVWTLRPA